MRDAPYIETCRKDHAEKTTRGLLMQDAEHTDGAARIAYTPRRLSRPYGLWRGVSVSENVLAQTDRYLSEIEARIMRQIAILARLNAKGQRTELGEKLLQEMWRSLELVLEYRRIHRHGRWSLSAELGAASDSARGVWDAGPAAVGDEPAVTEDDIRAAEERIIRQHALIDRLTALDLDTAAERQRLRVMQHDLDLMHERRRTTRGAR